jgi:hypothetical protein
VSDARKRIDEMEIEHLALCELELQAQVIGLQADNHDLRADNRTYRALAQAALPALHAAIIEIGRLTDRLRAALLELRNARCQPRGPVA